jgi:hypothetical protein
MEMACSMSARPQVAKSSAMPIRTAPSTWRIPSGLLRHLFQGAGSSLPCSGRTAADPTAADLDLLDVDESGTLDLADAVGVLQFLFQGRRPTLRLGAGCLAMDGCPALCRKE